MKPTILLVITACLMICFAGCDDKPSAPEAPPAPVADATPAGPVQDVELINPEFEIAIQESATEPRQYSVTWSARVKSGGWEMKTDNVLVEEELGKMAARVWVSIVQPNPSETVTQAVQTLTGKHDAGTTKIERVEFSVRQTVRGVNYSGPSAYYVAKTIKYPY